MAIIQQINIGSSNYQIAIPWYICSSAKDATTKSISGAEMSLVAGEQIVIKLSNGNSVASPLLSINGGTAKSIVGSGSCMPKNFTDAGSIMRLTYDGSNWNIIG